MIQGLGIKNTVTDSMSRPVFINRLRSTRRTVKKLNNGK